MKKCCICNTVIEREDAPILAMGAVGNPKLLCDKCAELLDIATMGREYEKIEAAMDEIGRKMGDSSPDHTTYNIVSGLMAESAGRAKAIKLGNYNFSLEEQLREEKENEEGEFDEIPDELRESEEDIAKDKEDEEKAKKFDKVYNVILACVIVVFVGVLAWRLIQTFLL